MLGFADAFFEHLRTFATSLGILEPSSYETGRGRDLKGVLPKSGCLEKK